MKNHISHFRVKGLHGRLDVDVPIEGNRLILLGNNGQGKTTIINLMYFVLSQQWPRLLDYQFEELSLSFGSDTLVLKRDDLQIAFPAGHRLLRAFTRLLPHSLRAQVDRRPDLVDTLLRERSNPHARSVLARELGMPLRHVDQLLQLAMDVAHDPQGRLFDEASNVRVQEECLRRNFDATVLYLPTYRRIERDLKAIFPGLEDEVRRFRANSTRRGHIELVEFGMEDVEDQLRQALGKVKDATRSQLNNLAGSYLRDVVRGQAHAFDADSIRSLSDEDVTRILQRVEEHTLNDDDKARLRSAIDRIKRKSELSDNDPFVAHYFAKLYDIHLELSRRENSIQRFAAVCSSYLTGKRVKFDDGSYTIQVLTNEGEELALRHLSSGEKQIVSLFAHLHLSPHEAFAVIIDEPELSLSVEWQKMLLPDIWKSERCPLVVAATHSPFIFENDFDPFAQDLAELTHAAAQ